MADKPKPVMPRRPEKRKPAKVKPLKDKELSDDVDLASELLSLEERACALLSMEYSLEHTATTLSWDLQAVHDTLKLPHVRLFIKKCDEKMVEEIAKTRIRRFTKLKISREAHVERLWDLAHLPPSETRGSIDGQIKALKEVGSILGYSRQDDPLDNMTPEELKEIVARTHRKTLEGKIETPVQ